tara:strand:+ start:405 stop:629 length:225 start_codon:yes stop_codon:yes gene_type:complete
LAFAFDVLLTDETERVIRVDRQAVRAITGVARIVTKKTGFTHHLPLLEFLVSNNQFLIEPKFLSLDYLLNTQEW